MTALPTIKAELKGITPHEIAEAIVIPMVENEEITWTETKVVLMAAGIDNFLDDGLIHREFLKLLDGKESIKVKDLHKLFKGMTY